MLEDVSLDAGRGGSLALLGRNGVGKTTLLSTLMGHDARCSGGALAWRGADLARCRRYRRAHAGIGWVPQERFMFPSLTVEEHLTVGRAARRRGRSSASTAVPAAGGAARNLGNQLSGGEQQMLAIGRR